MKKIIRLTESDLNRLVKRIITEQNDDRDRALSQNGGEPRRVPMRNRNLETSGYENDGRLLMLRNESADVVREHISNLGRNTQFLGIINCEYADFSDIDICGHNRLLFINVEGTDNNIDEQDYDCIDQISETMYGVSGQSM